MLLVRFKTSFLNPEPTVIPCGSWRTAGHDTEGSDPTKYRSIVEAWVKDIRELNVCWPDADTEVEILRERPADAVKISTGGITVNTPKSKWVTVTEAYTSKPKLLNLDLAFAITPVDGGGCRINFPHFEVIALESFKDIARLVE